MKAEGTYYRELTSAVVPPKGFSKVSGIQTQMPD